MLKVSWDSKWNVCKLEHGRIVVIDNSNLKIAKNNFCDMWFEGCIEKGTKNMVKYFAKFDKPGFTFPSYHLLGMWQRQINECIWVSVLSSVKKWNGDINSTLCNY